VKNDNAAALRPIKLKTYYLNFKTVRGLVTAFAAGLPLIPKVTPGTSTEYLLAPLGDLDNLARFSFAIFCLAVTYLVYFRYQGQSPTARKRTFLLCLMVIPLSSLCLYFVFCDSYVRKVDIPTIGRAAYVSVGYQRSEFANQNFASLTDEEMLRQRGLTEEEVRKLWTHMSLLAVRVILFFSWCGFLLPLILGLSLGVLDQLEKAPAGGKIASHPSRNVRR